MGIALAGCQEDVLTAIESHYDLFTAEAIQRTDSFQQQAAAQVDVLWVVDNSESMAQEQDNLGASFQSFQVSLDALGLDYQIGVISTDMADPTHQGRLLGSPAIITPGPDAATQFQANVHVGISGQANEQGLFAAYTALTQPLSENAGFLRADAGLAIIFVSDEDDYSFGDVAFYHREFFQIKGVGNDNHVQLAAIVGDAPTTAVPDGGCENTITGIAEYGERYHQLVELMGGTVQSICSQEFSVILEKISAAVAGLQREFSLGDVAGSADDVTVTVNSTTVATDPDTGWTYASGTILFLGAYVPPPGSSIEVTYGRTQTEFTLSKQPRLGAGTEGDGITVRVYAADAAECSGSDECTGDARCGLAGKCGAEEIAYGFADGWVLVSTGEGDSEKFVVSFEGSYQPQAGATIEVEYVCLGGCRSATGSVGS